MANKQEKSKTPLHDRAMSSKGAMMENGLKISNFDPEGNSLAGFSRRPQQASQRRLVNSGPNLTGKFGSGYTRDSGPQEPTWKDFVNPSDPKAFQMDYAMARHQKETNRRAKGDLARTALSHDQTMLEKERLAQSGADARNAATLKAGEAAARLKRSQDLFDKGLARGHAVTDRNIKNAIELSKVRRGPTGYPNKEFLKDAEDANDDWLAYKKVNPNADRNKYFTENYPHLAAGMGIGGNTGLMDQFNATNAGPPRGQMFGDNTLMTTDKGEYRLGDRGKVDFTPSGNSSAVNTVQNVLNPSGGQVTLGPTGKKTPVYNDWRDSLPK